MTIDSATPLHHKQHAFRVLILVFVLVLSIALLVWYWYSSHHTTSPRPLTDQEKIQLLATLRENKSNTPIPTSAAQIATLEQMRGVTTVKGKQVQTTPLPLTPEQKQAILNEVAGQ